MSANIAYAVLADVVASREHADEVELFATLERALREVNGRVEARQELALTIGDEMQGLYATLYHALYTCLLLQLHVKGRCELRFGIGVGEALSLRPGQLPAGQTGSAWWAARDAIERTARNQKRRRWPRSHRTVFLDRRDEAQGLDREHEATINALLLCRDHIVQGMDAVDAKIALALFDGRPQQEVADELSIAQSTVSWRQMNGGANTLFQTMRAFQASCQEDSSPKGPSRKASKHKQPIRKESDRESSNR